MFVLGEDLIEGGFEKLDLEKLELLVCTHITANKTADAATVVLPAAAWAEKRGSMINVTGRLQRLSRAIEPPASARDDWEIFRDLTTAVGGFKRDSHD